MGKRKKWNKQKIVDAIREHDRRGLPVAGIRKDDPCLRYAGIRWFGSWPNALLAAGLEPKVCRTWSKAAVVAAIKDRHQRGLPLSNVCKYDKRLENAACWYFGNWANAMSAAGLEKPMHKQRSWTKQVVIDEILDRNKRGLPMIHVAKYDRRLARAAVRLFGSWRDAVLAAGLKIRTRRMWSKEKIIEKIQWWHNKGVPPSKIHRHDCRLRNAGLRYFGSWNNAVGAAGFPIARHRWSRRLVIEAIREREQQGLSMLNVGRKDPSLSDAAFLYFGGWHKALRAAGLEPKVRRRWSQETVTKEIQARHQHGLPMTNLVKHDCSLAAAAYAYFGSWNNALAAAGFEPRKQKWNRQRVIDEVKAWHARGLPMGKIWTDYMGLTGAAKRYFNSWHEVLQAAGIESRPQEIWSEQRVISELQAWHKAGSPKRDMPAEYPGLLNAIQRYYGHWNNALVAAGLEPKRRGSWSRERVVREIQNRHVRGLPTRVASNQDKLLVAAAARYFGGWANALEAAGVLQENEKPKRPEKWSAERVIATIHTRHERGLPMTNILAHDSGLSRAACRFFGGWHNAVEAAGFQSKKMVWNKKRIVAEIRIRRCPDLGTNKMGADDVDLFRAAKDLFGSWPNAMRSAGFTSETASPKPQQQWSKQRVINEIKARYREGLYLAATWPANRFLASAAKRYFGGWHNALRAAGIMPEVILTWQKK